MPNSIVIKKKRRLTLKIFHFFLTIFLLLVIFVWSLNSILFYLFPMDEEVCFKKEISSGLWLYEVALLTNATAVDTYSFYLAPKIEGNPIKILEEKAPFLRGTAKKADISLIGTNKNVRYPHIMLKYHGKILEFHNLASTAHHDIFISLDAPYPVKDYRGD